MVFLHKNLIVRQLLMRDESSFRLLNQSNMDISKVQGDVIYKMDATVDGNSDIVTKEKGKMETCL